MHLCSVHVPSIFHADVCMQQSDLDIFTVTKLISSFVIFYLVCRLKWTNGGNE